LGVVGWDFCAFVGVFEGGRGKMRVFGVVFCGEFVVIDGRNVVLCDLVSGL
jgi:hypothetical protein